MTVVLGPNGKRVAAKSNPLAGRPRVVRGGRNLDLLELDYSEAYAKIYASQPWVAAAVNKLARGVARLPAKSYRDTDEGNPEYLRPRAAPAHPLPVLLSRPYPRANRFKLLEATVGSLAIWSKACWWKYRPGAGQAPVELWPLPWQYMSTHVGGNQGVDLFEYNGPAGRKFFHPDDVVYFEWWSPAGEQGTSPFEQLRLTLALEEAGRRYAVSSFANGVRPSGALKIPRTLEPHEKEELRAEIQLMNGGPDAAFRLALLDGGMEWVPFSGSAVDAQTIEHRKLNREEVCAVFDIPPPVLHILDRATFSNISEQNKALYRETLGPWLTMIEETIDAQLIWGEPDFAGTYVEFDLNEVLKADLVQRAQAYRLMETTLTANERRALENRRPIGDANDPANPANGILYPLNSGIILPDGTLLEAPEPAAGAGVEGALAALVDERVAAALDERDLATVAPSADPVTVPAE